MSQAASQEATRAGRRFERHSTRHRGITFRKRTDGSRSYFVYWQSSYLKAGETLESALALQSELRARKGKGQKVIVPAKITCGELLEQWFEGKTRVARLDEARLPRRARQRPAAALRRLDDRRRRRGRDREARPRPRT